MDLDKLSPELQEKAKDCKTPEEMIELARQEGYELADSELDAIAGGSWNGCEAYEPEHCRVPFGR